MRALCVKSCLAIGLTTVALLSTTTSARAVPFTISIFESDMQPRPFDFNATPGTVLLCDSTGANSSKPMYDKAAGGWGCYSTATNKPVEASDLISFAARPGDKALPSQATMCSDVDQVKDTNDEDPACKGVGLVVVNAGYALLEVDANGKSNEGALEEIAYVPAGVGSPGYATKTMSGDVFIIDYKLVSDQPKPPDFGTPEPSTWLMLLTGALMTPLVARRMRNS